MRPYVLCLRKMRCPFCQTDSDKVIDSREADEGRVVRRRRQCLTCGKRYTTYEHIEARRRLSVIKRDGSRVPYERTKMLTGLELACFKRPLSAQQLNQLVDEVEEHIFKTYDREVASAEIGRLIADRLKRLDHVAYVRFASVYKQFRDLDDLLDEVRDVLQASEPVNGPDQGRLF